MTTPKFKAGDDIRTTRGVRWSATGRFFNAGAPARVQEVLPDACADDGLARYRVTISGEDFDLCESCLEPIPPADES